MKNPVTTIIGILQLLITIIAAVFPKAFGIDWSNIDTQQAVIAGFTAILNGVFGLIMIFKAGDKSGGV